MRRTDFHGVDEALAEGFFADRIVRLLAHERELSERDRVVIARAVAKLQDALKGREAVRTGHIGFKGIDGVAAYARSAELVGRLQVGLVPLPAEGLVAIIESAVAELNAVLTAGKVEPGKVPQAQRYFIALQDATLEAAAATYPVPPLPGRERSSLPV